MAGNNETKDESTENPLHAMNSQESSFDLFKLPPELRLLIYRHLFLSTRLTYGANVYQCTNIIPARYSLALLKTCRRVRNEIGDSWLRHVLFNFAEVDHMLIILKGLPMATLSKIRHVQVLGTVRWFYAGPRRNYGDEYTLVQILKLLPGLQLDTFTVLSPYEEECDYKVLDTLIKYGEGWKELRFICQISLQLGYQYPGIDPNNHDIMYPRKPQPAHWASVMNTRDGIQNQPSVTMYRSTLPGEACSVMHEATRVIIEQMPLKEKETIRLIPPLFPQLRPEEKKKAREFMVVVKRGKGINYQEEEHPRYLTAISDIRKDFADKTWAEIKSECLRWRNNRTYHGMCYADDDTEEPLPVADIYQHVNEYNWTELEKILY